MYTKDAKPHEHGLSLLKGHLKKPNTPSNFILLKILSPQKLTKLLEFLKN